MNDSIQGVQVGEFSEEMRRQKQKEQLDLQHAMQTGVKYELEHEVGAATRPLADADVLQQLKHLRVGINSALVFHGALVALLDEKGIIDYDDYLDASLKKLKEEVQSYEKRLSEKFGAKITLH